MEEKKGMSLGTKVVISYIICFGLAIGSFFGFTILRIVLGLNSSQGASNIVLAFLQYIVPIMFLLFGWAPPLIFRKKEDKIN